MADESGKLNFRWRAQPWPSDAEVEVRGGRVVGGGERGEAGR